jgi:transposase-like protein
MWCIFPNAESCLRLVRALAVETHENWLEGTRHLNMQRLAGHKKAPSGPFPYQGSLHDLLKTAQ